MKVYYGASKGHSDSGLEELVQNTIPRILKKNGNSLGIYSYNPVAINDSKSFAQIAEQIQDADVFIGEMSRPSQTLGFQLAYALNLGKPCLYIYNQNRQGEPDFVISKHPSRLLRLATYQDTKDLEAELQSFMKLAKTQMNSSRTSFMSTSRIDQYVDSASKKIGISKGEVIRQLLDDAITSNKFNLK